MEQVLLPVNPDRRLDDKNIKHSEILPLFAQFSDSSSHSFSLDLRSVLEDAGWKYQAWASMGCGLVLCNQQQ